MRRLPTFVITWLVSVPRCISKYSSPCHTGTGAPVAASASTASKNPSTVPSSSRGRPSRSAIRRARSTISRVGPPPPLPWPYGVSDQSLQPCSWKLRTQVGLLRRHDHGVVRLHRREVREHPAAVDALPPEGAVGEPVLLVPRQLLRHEAVAPGGGEDLRERGRVAEHVGDPDLAATAAEVLLEETLTVDELADDGLPARDVGVRLHPHAAHGDPLPGGGLLLDAGEQRRMPLPHPLVLQRPASTRTGSPGSRP